jgi:hypothetical protein
VLARTWGISGPSSSVPGQGNARSGVRIAVALPAVPGAEACGDPLDGFSVLFVGGPAAGEVGEGDGAVEGEGLGEDDVLFQLSAGGGGLR